MSELYAVSHLAEVVEKLNRLLEEFNRLLEARDIHLPRIEVPKITLPEITLPEVSLIPILDGLLPTLTAISEKLTPLMDFYTPRSTYFYEASTLVVGQSPRRIQILEKELRRSGRWGFAVSDNSTIQMKINGGQRILLYVGEEHIFDGRLAIDQIDLETTSAVALGYRIFLM